MSITATIPAGDPLADHLVPGAALGLLGIVPETRRRNRLNGRVLRVRSPAEMDAEGLHRLPSIRRRCASISWSTSVSAIARVSSGRVWRRRGGVA
ncbi:hypothetical protein ACFQ4K_23105 [Tistrella bauzanensis]